MFLCVVRFYVPGSVYRAAARLAVCTCLPHSRGKKFSLCCISGIIKCSHSLVCCAVAGDHDASVPEEEVWWDQNQPLPVSYLTVTVHFD